jgi:hypothetical protein
MVDSTVLVRRASELRDWAEHEADEAMRSRLIRMADDYEHSVGGVDAALARVVAGPLRFC